MKKPSTSPKKERDQIYFITGQTAIPLESLQYNGYNVSQSASMSKRSDLESISTKSAKNAKTPINHIG